MRTGSTKELQVGSAIPHSRAQRGVHELVRADRVFLLLRSTQLRAVELRRDAVDEPPLQDGALDRADGVLGVRVEVEAETALVAVDAVTRAPQLDRELEGLHE